MGACGCPGRVVLVSEGAGQMGGLGELLRPRDAGRAARAPLRPERFPGLGAKSRGLGDSDPKAFPGAGAACLPSAPGSGAAEGVSQGSPGGLAGLAGWGLYLAVGFCWLGWGVLSLPAQRDRGPGVS